MPLSRTILASLLVACASAASAQEKPPATKLPAKDASPVVACTSLSNLRTILRKANDDPAAAVSVVSDMKMELNCGVLDRTAVTGIADHVSLNGRAYDCLGLQNTSICHWTVAGAVTPPAAPPTEPQSKPAPPKPRR